MYAIYARQSVERKESISIEMQKEMCLKCLPYGEKFEIYEDRGYSGTNTNRPAFRKMIHSAKEGKLKGIIVYKLDRISRSLWDFASIWECLEKKKTELISCTEGIDSTTPLGQMLIKMLIMFAEMEQKNISARIRDNYIARAEKMLALGGRVPIGYNKDWSIDANCVEIVESCFRFVAQGESLESTGRKFGFSGTQTGRIVRNPVYVKCSDYVLKRLNDEGYTILGSTQNYRNGCGIHAIVSGNEKYISPSVHHGIISPELWLAARDNLNSRRPSSNSGSGSLSWIQGLILCGKCGESCYVRDNGKGRPYLYITCRGRRRGICTGLHGIRAESVEKWVWNILSDELPYIIKFDIPNDKAQDSMEIRSFSENDSAEKIFLMERERILETRKKTKYGSFQHINKKMLKALPFSVKKSLCRVLIKNIIVTEEKFTLILQ